jgi:hypothetical protein
MPLTKRWKCDGAGGVTSDHQHVRIELRHDPITYLAYPRHEFCFWFGTIGKCGVIANKSEVVPRAPGNNMLMNA